jgi:anti-anti-sigma factor
VGKCLRMNLDISVSTLNGLTWVTLDGQLDIATARALQREMGRVELATTELRLDLSRLSFVDSTGLSVLLGLANRAEEHGRRVVLVSPRPEVARLLRLVDVVRRFDMIEAAPGVGART